MNNNHNPGHNILKIFDVLAKFFSPQVKRSVIISNEDGIYKLPQELPNDLTFRILGNLEKSGKNQNFIELQPSAKSSFQNENFENSLNMEIEPFP